MVATPIVQMFQKFTYDVNVEFLRASLHVSYLKVFGKRAQGTSCELSTLFPRRWVIAAVCGLKCRLSRC